MDETIIQTINKLQDAFTTVGVQNPVDLPQIVVIGRYAFSINYIIVFSHLVRVVAKARC